MASGTSGSLAGDAEKAKLLYTQGAVEQKAERVREQGEQTAQSADSRKQRERESERESVCVCLVSPSPSIAG